MELEQRWCDNATCRDYGNVGAGNIKAFSHVERRYYCATCRRTFSADKHTFFETLRARARRYSKLWPCWSSATA